MDSPVRGASPGLRDGTLGGFAWSLGGSGTQAILRIAVLAVLARLLTPADFGLLGAALIVVGLSEIFCFIGVAPSIIQRSELESRHVQVAWTLSLMLGLTTTALVYSAAPLIADFFRMNELVPVVHWISLVFILHAISLVGRALLQRDLEFKTLAICEFASFIVYAVVATILAMLGFGVMSLVGAYLASAGIQSFLILLVKPHPKALRIQMAAAGDLLGFGVGFSLNHLLSYLAKQGDNLVVGRWLGSSALGAYGRAYALMTAPVTVAGQVMDKVLFASICRVQDNKRRMSRAFRSVTAVVAVITLPVSAISFIAAQEVVLVLLGSEWTDVIAPFQVLAMGMFFRVAYKISGAVNRGVGVVYRMAWRQGLYVAIIVGGALIGQNWGLSGVALAVFSGVVAAYVLMTGLTLRILDLGWRELASILLAPLLLSLLTGLPAWFVAEMVRRAELNPVDSLLLIVASWALALAITLHLRLRWFLDHYTYNILDDLCARIPLGSRALAFILPQRNVQEILEDQR